MSAISHQINIPQVARSVGTPLVKSVWNEFDEHGLLLGLSRLKGEDNWSYKRRLSTVMVNRANASYRGLVNGITRELGLDFFYPITINPRVDESGNFLATDPYIKFEGMYVYLYSDYANGLLDYQIDRWKLGGNYEHCGRLVDLINTTAFFQAELLDEDYRFSRSMTILNQSNRIQSGSVDIPAADKFQLEDRYLVPGSFTFFNTDNNTDLRLIEVDSPGDLDGENQFYVDYKNGIIQLYQPIGLYGFMKYQYVDYPFKPIASPVILADINSESFKPAMFQQVLQDDGTYAHGLPTELGVDIINELMTVFPLYWGV